ncbi:MAG: Cof-type HAD-IIB family hydrolase [Planctomycetes bacterium]|nr:Cof-type HAD-IIB family hydrolase [Planctomycetota bacterium]
MIARRYDAILLDLDGTLVDERDEIHPRTFAALHAAHQRGVRVLIATGRSELATVPVLDKLGLDTPAIVFNGAGLWCPAKRRLIEERVLSKRTLERALAFGERHGLLAVSMCAGAKYTLEPRNEMERLALKDMRGLVPSTPEEMRFRRAIRVTLFSETHGTSAEFADEVERAIAQPVYMTHFPLNVLAHHRSSRLQVVDIHPPCRGKAEGLRVLEELFGVAPERVVAVGDATNDIPMFEAAGLAVAMGDGMREALEAADRTIGNVGTDTIGALVEELFLD